MLKSLHFPGFAGLGQFRPHILAFQEQADRLRAGEMLCIGQQLVERRAGAGGDDIKGQRLDIFHAGVANFWVQPKFSGHFRQKGAFFGRRFEQRDLCPAPQELRQDKSRKAGAAAKIGKGLGALRNKPYELSAIPDMPPPDIGEGAG